MVSNYNNSNQKNGFIILSYISFKLPYFLASERLSPTTFLMLPDFWFGRWYHGPILATRYLSCVNFYTVQKYLDTRFFVSRRKAKEILS